MLWIRRPCSIVASTTTSSDPVTSQPQTQRFVNCWISFITVSFSSEISERLGDIFGEDRPPGRWQLGGDDGVILGQPCEVPQAVLDDGAGRDRSWRRGRLGSSELRPADRQARHIAHEIAVDDDHEAQDHGIAIAPPRRRVDEDRRPDDVADDPVDHLDRVLDRAQLEDPRLRTVRSRQLQAVAIEPDHEDLGLDRAVDIPTGGHAAHRAIVATSGPRRLEGVTNASIAGRRLHASGLLGRRPASLEDAVGRLGAVQSQDYPGAAWGLAQRVRDRSLDDVTARYDRGSILRTHAMRPTWHFVLPADIRALQALTGPRVHARNASMYRRLEIDDRATRSRCRRALVKALRDGHEKTRAEISAVLGEAGIDATGQRLAYIVMRAELDGLICSGAFRGKQFTYALLDEKAPPMDGFDREAARADLVRRYYASHGPALIRDFVWWSGLTTSDAKAGIASLGGGLVREEMDGKEYWSAANATADTKVPAGTIHLLPNYDEYLGSYADYEPIFDPALPRARTIADVLGVHIVVRNGFVVGGWKRRVEADRVVVDLTLILPLAARDERALERALDDYGRFLDRPVVVRRRHA